MADILLPIKEEFRDKFFKGQQANEEFVCFFRKHWVSVLPSIALLVFLYITIIIFAILFHKISGIANDNIGVKLLYFGVVVAATVYMHKIFSGIFSYFMNIVIFTNNRIIEHKKTLFVEDSHEVLDIVKIQDVRKYQNGVFKNLSGYGDLLIVLSSSQATKLFKYVPNVNFHFRCLARLKKDVFFYDRNFLRGYNGLTDANSSLVAHSVQKVLEKTNTNQ